jgi:hypothetical protein
MTYVYIIRLFPSSYFINTFFIFIDIKVYVHVNPSSLVVKAATLSLRPIEFKSAIKYVFVLLFFINQFILITYLNFYKLNYFRLTYILFTHEINTKNE